MSARSHNAIVVATVVVAAAGLAGIAAIEGWLPSFPAVITPASVASPGQSFVGTAPMESLSPGESVVTPPQAAKPEAPPVPAKPPAQAQAAPAEKRRATCPHCGVVSSTAHRPAETQQGAWEVRVKFDDGTRATLRFPTDPRFRVGDRVTFNGGRLQRQ
jgi:hypothetical protein